MTRTGKLGRFRRLFRQMFCGLAAAGIVLQMGTPAEAGWVDKLKPKDIITAPIQVLKKTEEGARKISRKGIVESVKWTGRYAEGAVQTVLANAKGVERDLKNAPKSGRQFVKAPGNTLVRAASRTGEAVKDWAGDMSNKIQSTWWYGQIKGELLRQFMEKPRYILVGGERPGSAVIYINGMATSKSKARAAAEEIAKQLNRPVKLLYNPTSSPVGDLEECTEDRVWPVWVVGRLGRMTANVLPTLTGSARLQHNQTTRMIAWELYHAKSPVSVIAHSQGNLIMRNALFTMTLLSAKDKARNAAWVLAGPPLNNNEILTKAGRQTILDYKNDPVAKAVGLRGGGIKYNGANHDFVRFVPQLTNDMLWPQSK